MVDNSLKITSMSQIRYIFIGLGIEHIIKLIVAFVAICKAVRHKKVDKIGSIDCSGFVFFYAQRIVLGIFKLAVTEYQAHCTGFGRFRNLQINHQIVWIFYFLRLFNTNSRIR